MKYTIASIMKAKPKLTHGKKFVQYSNSSYQININHETEPINKFLIVFFELLSEKFLFINGKTQFIKANNNIAIIEK